MITSFRAYSSEDKQQREEKIIEAAQTLLTEKSFYAINMDEVAKSAVLAKGTVYLYFKTKEELFLSVFERQAQTWFCEVQSGLAEFSSPATPETVVKLLVDSVKDKPQLTRLTALKQIVIEHNISFECAHEDKLRMQARTQELGEMIAAKLGLPAARGVQLLDLMQLFVAGLEGVARPSLVSKQVFEQEPSLRTMDFAVELSNLLLAMLQSCGAAREDRGQE